MALKSFQEASGWCCRLTSAHPLVLKVALSHSKYYYEVMSSVEFAMRILGEAMLEAKEEFLGFKKRATD